MKRTGRERGFTLLELLLTLTVTTIGLIGLLSLHMSIARGNDGTSRSGEAVTIGNQTLEGLRSLRPTDMMYELVADSTATPPQTVTLGTSAGRNGLTYTRRVLVTAVAGSGLWKVRVEVGWTEDGAAAGAAGGLYDHLIAVEVIRTVLEAL